MKIGKKLKTLRTERNETQSQVAKAIGTAPRHYQRFESDEGLPGLELFAAMANHFQVNMDYLAGRTDLRDMLPPRTMETLRLHLRPFRDEDAEDVFAYAKNPAVGPVAGWPPHNNEAESLEIIRTVFSNPGVFAIELKETGRVVGSVGFVGGHPEGLRPECPDDELGYALSQDCWGRGLATEAARAVLRYGFEVLKLRRIWCGHYEGNDRSRRVVEKLGFRYQFEREEAVPLLDEVRRTHFYTMTEEDWRGQLPGSGAGRGE